MSKPNSFETTPPQERAILVAVNPDASEDEYVDLELHGLCEAAGVEPVALIRQRLDRPVGGTFLGKGKLVELATLVQEVAADVAIVDGELNGIQQRNVQDTIACRVVDRTQLILDIFAGRATTKEGMLQVELAQLTYMLPKLMSVYTKFERQKGGIGMRGPGETKLETDRRMVRDRIAKLQDEIVEVSRVRKLQRAGRRKHPFPFASIVGYTSAGKSTLMNRLAKTDLLADAMPFATLDPTTRKVDLDDGYSVFVTDTVGFIRNLPTHLVAAFESTLEEATDADFLIHLIDVSIENWEMQRDAVLETLERLKAHEKPTITVFNKIDAMPDPTEARRLVAEWPNSVAISAQRGTGINDLMAAMIRQVQGLLGRVEALVPYSEASLVQECYNFGRVHTVEYRDEGIWIVADLVAEMRGRLARFSAAHHHPPTRS
ncbi:MAG: GTPase HflX [Fimbriimonadaceae bacterium]|nr:GTPase HflX [Fimbriimonadaceae bacterium]